MAQPVNIKIEEKQMNTIKIIAPLAFAFSLVGCDKEDDSSESPTCTYSSECGAEAICLEGQCVAAGPECNDGDLYCKCLPDLTCSDNSLQCFEETLVCIPDECPNGTLGCECLQGNTGCLDDLSCVDAVCQYPPSEDCTNECEYALDGECDDGRPGSITSLCEPGTDCGDCGR